jgi:hypothetical protein
MCFKTDSICGAGLSPENNVTCLKTDSTCGAGLRPENNVLCFKTYSTVWRFQKGNQTDNAIFKHFYVIVLPVIVICLKTHYIIFRS